MSLVAQHLFEGRSHDDIAAELGVTGATARQRYSRAIRRLSEAVSLLDELNRRGIHGAQEDAIGLFRCRGATPAEIALGLRLPEALVRDWIADVRPIFQHARGDAP
jgi:hypothetical protein